jgi:hypothetical protein
VADTGRHITQLRLLAMAHWRWRSRGVPVVIEKFERQRAAQCD